MGWDDETRERMTSTAMTNSLILSRDERERERERERDTTIYSNNSGGIGKEKNNDKRKIGTIIISPPSAGWKIKTADFITDERAMYR